MRETGDRTFGVKKLLFIYLTCLTDSSYDNLCPPTVSVYVQNGDARQLHKNEESLVRFGGAPAHVSAPSWSP